MKIIGNSNIGKYVVDSKINNKNERTSVSFFTKIITFLRSKKSIQIYPETNNSTKNTKNSDAFDEISSDLKNQAKVARENFNFAVSLIDDEELKHSILFRLTSN